MHPCVCMNVVRLQVSNVPVRNCSTTGVQIPSKVLIMVMYAERGKAVSSPCARHGRQTVRHVVGGAARRVRKKQKPSCNEEDRACNMAQLKIRNSR